MNYLEQAAASTRTEAEERERMAQSLDAEVEFWKRARERQTFGPYTDYAYKIDVARARAAKLRKGAPS